MARWLLACALLIGVPAMMLTAPVVGDGAGTAAAVAVVAVLVLTSVVLLCGLSTGPKAAGR